MPLRLSLGLAVLLLFGGLAHAERTLPERAHALQARHASLQQALASSPFGRPLLVEAGTADEAPHGDVWAVVDHGFDTLARALRQPQAWCEILLLQTNVKRCSAHRQDAQAGLQMAITRRYTDPPDEAQTVDFRFDTDAQPGYFTMQMAAEQGPLGTRDYRLRFEAVPLTAQQTFVHLWYAYQPGLAARLATSAYLAGPGRRKVGFTITGHDADGRPAYVGGIQGIAERNTMRYFLAIESYLGTLGEPVEQRLLHFHAALERYPAQLHETTEAEYLAMKQRELGTR